jgi:SAM-dependent methyltransferase
MSIPNKDIQSSREIIDFYSEHLKKFGSSAQGVGWKNDEAQFVRFDQLSKVIHGNTDFSINDLGCGTGRYYKYLIRENFTPVSYCGYDILNDMILLADKELMPDPKVKLIKIDSPLEMNKSDYTVASGIFNVKYEAKESEWLNHILTTLESMNEKSHLGFAFNSLTKYSDKEYMQSYLYYADPLFLFDYCKKNFSKNVALLHDYYQYDFTIIVRKN